MKITFFLMLVMFSLLNCQGQSKVDIAFQKVKSFYLNYSTCYNKSIHYNKFSNTLDVNDNIIPMPDIVVQYQYSESQNIDLANCVEFHCSNYNKCIELPRKDGIVNLTAGVGFAFKTKEQCYSFIDLLADLKQAIGK